MRGKNVGKFARSRRPPSDGGTCLRDDRAPKNNVLGVSVPREEGKDTEGWTLATPRNVASELSLLELGNDRKPYILELIYRGRSDWFCGLPRWPPMWHSPLMHSDSYLSLHRR
jgi:hypothetical protein